MLYCGGPDQWAPKSHMEDIQEAKTAGSLPNNITLEYMDDLVHGFIVYPQMVGPAADFVCRSIASATVTKGQNHEEINALTSKL